MVLTKNDNSRLIKIHMQSKTNDSSDSNADSSIDQIILKIKKKKNEYKNFIVKWILNSHHSSKTQIQGCTMSKQAKNKAPAAVQITAEQILREANERQEKPLDQTRQKITDPEELKEFQ